MNSDVSNPTWNNFPDNDLALKCTLEKRALDWSTGELCSIPWARAFSDVNKDFRSNLLSGQLLSHRTFVVNRIPIKGKEEGTLSKNRLCFYQECWNISIFWSYIEKQGWYSNLTIIQRANTARILIKEIPLFSCSWSQDSRKQDGSKDFNIISKLLPRNLASGSHNINEALTATATTACLEFSPFWKNVLLFASKDFPLRMFFIV